jgi:hypothetical protein
MLTLNIKNNIIPKINTKIEVYINRITGKGLDLITKS